MDNKSIQSILQEVLEEEIPSSQIDLLPSVKASLVAGRHLLNQQGEKMNTTQPRRTPRAALVTLTIIILMALAFITPQGRAFAQSILQFFIRSESDVVAVPTSGPMNWVNLTATVVPATQTPVPERAAFADKCGDFSAPTCSLEQIRSLVDFTVKEPGKMEGLYFIGASGGPDSIFLSYSSQDMSFGLTVFVERWTGVPSVDTDLVGASATVEQVQIGDLHGEYFKGSFVYQDGQDVATWDPNFGTETLRWVDGGTSYKMVYGSFQNPINKEGMVALAESMTIEPVTKLPMPIPTVDPYAWDPANVYNLSVSEAEEQAGFKLVLPSELPEILSLFAASYDSERGVVQVFYPLNQSLYGPTSSGVLLSQQIAADPTDCDLCDISVGDYNDFTEEDSDYKRVVPGDSNLEIVQIGAVTGKYVEGVWSGTDCCGWVWDPQPYLKTLRWWKDGVAFEITYGGLELEKADLIRIAESIH